MTKKPVGLPPKYFTVMHYEYGAMITFEFLQDFPDMCAEMNAERLFAMLRTCDKGDFGPGHPFSLDMKTGKVLEWAGPHIRIIGYRSLNGPTFVDEAVVLMVGKPKDAPIRTYKQFMEKCVPKQWAKIKEDRDKIEDIKGLLTEKEIEDLA